MLVLVRMPVLVPVHVQVQVLVMVLVPVHVLEQVHVLVLVRVRVQRVLGAGKLAQGARRRRRVL